MKILVLTNNYPPEMGAASQGYYELATSLHALGHSITVVTGFPRYRMHEKREHGLFRRETEDGVNIVRVASLPFDVTGPIMRGIDHLYLAASMVAGGCLARRHDVVFAYSPPLTLGISAWALDRVWRVPSVVNVQDLFPKYAIDTGLMNNKGLIRGFEAMEHFIYRNARSIVVHSDGNEQHVISLGGSPDRVSVIPNWADTDFIVPGPRHNEARVEWGLHDEFVVQYSGTMGYQQDLDTLVDAAALLKDRVEIAFVLIGDGVQRPRLMSKAQELSLHNVIFPPMQPWERYPLTMQAADACPIALAKDVQTPGIPSKIFSIMAAGKPVLLSVPAASDATGLVEETGCGLVVPPGQPQHLANAILHLQQHPTEAAAMGARGRQRVEREFSRTRCAQQFSALFEHLVRESRPEK
jgi:colanic acid biosynthesis glycosyl transferase WcaI